MPTSPLRYLKNVNVNCVYSGSLSNCGSHQGRSLSIDPALYRFSDSTAQLVNPKTGKYVHTRMICLKPKKRLSTIVNSKNYFNKYQNGEELVNCDFGDLYPELSLNSAKNICSHAVKSVRYDFHWKGTELLSLTSTIVIIDAAPPILQNFAVNFLYKDEPLQLPIKSSRSGVFGYDVQHPLIAKYNGTEKYLHIWKPGKYWLHN